MLASIRFEALDTEVDLSAFNGSSRYGLDLNLVVFILLFAVDKLLVRLRRFAPLFWQLLGVVLRHQLDQLGLLFAEPLLEVVDAERRVERVALQQLRQQLDGLLAHVRGPGE